MVWTGYTFTNKNNFISTLLLIFFASWKYDRKLKWTMGIIKLIYDVKKIAHRKDPLQTDYGVDRLYIHQ